MRAPARDAGMAAVEAVLFAPLALASAALVAQVSWTFFQTACFEQALAQAPARLEQQGIDDGGAQEFREAVLAHWTPLDAACLDVESASIEERTTRVTRKTESEIDHGFYLIEEVSDSSRVLAVEANAAYTIRPIVPLPGFVPVTIERHVERSVLSSARFEVF